MIKRRDFLRFGLMMGAGVLMPRSLLANTGERTLHLYHIHTHERIRSTFWVDGEYIYEELENLEYFLRDYRNDEIHKIDLALIEYLYDIQSLLNPKEIHIISGFRSKYTNNYLRRHSKGVAKNSYHTKGKAVDIRIPELSISTLKYAALSLKRGGVGYYPRSNFVHIDTGMPRYWRFPKR